MDKLFNDLIKYSPSENTTGCKKYFNDFLTSFKLDANFMTYSNLLDITEKYEDIERLLPNLNFENRLRCFEFFNKRLTFQRKFETLFKDKNINIDEIKDNMEIREDMKVLWGEYGEIDYEFDLLMRDLDPEYTP